MVPPALRVTEAPVKESERSYSAGRGGIQTIAVCNEPRKPVVSPALRVTEAQEQQQTNQMFPTSDNIKRNLSEVGK